MKHSRAAYIFFDMDIRNVWWRSSSLGRGLMASFKWPTKHGKGVQHRAKL